MFLTPFFSKCTNRIIAQTHTFLDCIQTHLKVRCTRTESRHTRLSIQLRESQGKRGKHTACTTAKVHACPMAACPPVYLHGRSACMSNGHSTCNMFHSRHETEKGVNGEATGGRRPPGQQVGLLQSCLLQMQHETGSIGEVLVSLVGSLVP